MISFIEINKSKDRPTQNSKKVLKNFTVHIKNHEFLFYELQFLFYELFRPSGKNKNGLPEQFCCDIDVRLRGAHQCALDVVDSTLVQVTIFLFVAIELSALRNSKSNRCSKKFTDIAYFDLNFVFPCY